MPKEATAHHEAGHAVIARALGYYVQAMSIEGSGQLHGEVQLDKPRMRDIDRDFPHFAVAVALAGPLAERRIVPHLFRNETGESVIYTNPDGDTDLEKACTHLSRLVRGRPVSPDDIVFCAAWEYLDVLVDYAREPIATLAKHLLSIGVVTGQEKCHHLIEADFFAGGGDEEEWWLEKVISRVKGLPALYPEFLFPRDV